MYVCASYHRFCWVAHRGFQREAASGRSEEYSSGVRKKPDKEKTPAFGKLEHYLIH